MAQKVYKLYTSEELGTIPKEAEKVRLHQNVDHVVSGVHEPEIITYIPSQPSSNKTAVVIVPGGGHREIWIDHEGHRVAEWLQARGIASVVLKYRLANEEGSKYTVEGHAVKDAHKAIAFVRSHAEEWGIDPKKVGILGFSAGGHLAGLSALMATSDDVKPNFQGLIYPGWIDQLEPKKGLPPAFMLAGADDNIAKELPDLYLKYKKLNIPAELHMLAKPGHGFGVRTTNHDASKLWVDRFVEWLDDMGFGPSLLPTLEAQLLMDTRSKLGEGAIWHPEEKMLYWMDIENFLLYKYNPKTNENTKFDMGQRIGTVVPATNGKLIVALMDGIYSFDPITGSKTLMSQPYQDTNLRLNDGKCDPSGRFWVGTMTMNNTRKGGKLYKLDHDGKVTVMLDSVSISNGIVWSSDRKSMYYNDTPTSTVQAFDYDDLTGTISNQRVIIKFKPGEGNPDGMSIDADDNIWIALWGGNAVKKYDPKSGKLLQIIKVPAPNVTACAFGGENLDILYITTARNWMRPDLLETYPMSGSVFTVKPGVKGQKASFYGPVK